MGAFGNSLIRVGTVRGQPIAVGERQAVPVAWTVALALAFADNAGIGLAWTRPVAIEVTGAGGMVRIAVPDVTRRAVFTVGAIGLLLPPLLYTAIRGIRRITAGKSRREFA